MHGVFFDVLTELLADRPGGGFRRIGGAHDFAIFRDGIIAFKHRNKDRLRTTYNRTIPEKTAALCARRKTLGPARA